MQEQVEDILVKERDLLVQNMSNHNVKLASSRGWSLFFWTDASLYLPMDSVSVFFRLIPEDQPALTHPQLRINIRLSQVAWGNKELNIDVSPTFERVHRDLWGWETKVENCFNSEMPPGLPAPAGAAPLPRGAFLMTVLVSSPDGLEFRIDQVPIEILTKQDMREHVRFWKSKGKEQTDFLPELIKKE